MVTWLALLVEMNRLVSRVVRLVAALSKDDTLGIIPWDIELGTACIVPIAETQRFLLLVNCEVSLEILRGPWQPTANLPKL